MHDLADAQRSEVVAGRVRCHTASRDELLARWEDRLATPLDNGRRFFSVFARVAVWEPMPTDDRQWVLDAAKAVPGVLNAYHLVDPATGNGLSVAFFEDDVDVAAVRDAITSRAEAIGWHDQPRPSPASETIYRVLRSSEAP